MFKIKLCTSGSKKYLRKTRQKTARILLKYLYMYDIIHLSMH